MITMKTTTIILRIWTVRVKERTAMLISLILYIVYLFYFLGSNVLLNSLQILHIYFIATFDPSLYCCATTNVILILYTAYIFKT